MIRSGHEKERTVSDAVDGVYPQAAAEPEPERRSILRNERGSQRKKRASLKMIFTRSVTKLHVGRN